MGRCRGTCCGEQEPHQVSHCSNGRHSAAACGEQRRRALGVGTSGVGGVQLADDGIHQRQPLTQTLEDVGASHIAYVDSIPFVRSNTSSASRFRKMLIGIVLSDLRPALAGGSRNPLKIGLECDHEASGLTARHHAVVKGERQRQYAPHRGLAAMRDRPLRNPAGAYDCRLRRHDD